MTDTCEFYWLLPNALAGSAYPGPCLGWLYHKMGIRTIVSLHPLESKDKHHAESLGLKITTVPIEDFTPVTPEQRNQAVQAIHEALLLSRPTLVHCKGGLGRTGMILALYLVRKKQVSVEKAISKIRNLRLGSIETPEQEAAITTENQAM